MKKKLLVTLDGSDHSKYSLLWALENLIDTENNSLLLLSVGVLSAGTPYEYSAVTRNILNGDDEIRLERQQVEEQAKVIIDYGKDIIKNFFAKRGQETPLSVECFIDSYSDPAKYIVNFSREQTVDILVIGHRGMSSPDATNMGSVSQYCLHSAACTVVITRKKENQAQNIS